MLARALRNPTVIDWLPVCVLPPVLVINAGLSSLGKPLTPVSVMAAIVSCLPLVLRRRLSFPALMPLLVAGVVLALWLLHPVDTVVVIPMVALFELAMGGDRRRSLWMSVAVVPCVFVSVIPFASGAAHIAGIVVRNLALCLLAIAVGDILRSRQAATAQAVAAAEEATLRRVADERLQIAREIHDVVAHAMTAINVQAGVAAHLLQRDPGQAHQALRDIKRTSGEALGELRHTLGVLRDPVNAAEAAPIRPAGTLHDLEQLTGGLRSAGVAVQLDVKPLADVPAAVHGAGYRIVQEALTNVARHAHASCARVSVQRVNGAVTIEVVDDGAGGDGDEGAGAGNGVRGMRERAAALGGTLQAARDESGGWRVSASLPVAGPRT